VPPATVRSLAALPTRLTAPTAGWELDSDVVVVGSGIAGLTAALQCRRAGRVLLVTKSYLAHGATNWAQGGIAAALSPLDSPEAHLQDTLEAGVGVCDEEAVRALVTEGPQRVRELIALGATFDTDAAGELALTREGGHGTRRVIHAGGDATGAEVERALVAAVRRTEGIEVIEHALVLDLLRGADGQAAGLTLHVLGEGTIDGVGAVRARAVVLATGGMGQVYAATTNPTVSTGDGVALALRAGAEVSDLEFVQFHPTALHLPSTRETGAPQPLISEAMRGEGAVLVDASGRSVMAGVHPRADLAPRDIVAKAMSRLMAEQDVDHLFLDARQLGEEKLLRHFPTIVARCREAGIDPVLRPIPVSPAAHYASGGVRTDLYGRTTIPGLFACGEVACSGVHGANRLASNSLLEGLVFAHRIGDTLADHLPAPVTAVSVDGVSGLVEPATRSDLAREMTADAGVLRSADSLSAAAKSLAAMADRVSAEPSPDSWQATNLHAVASVLVQAALMREETRGGHWRDDHPDADARWRGHINTSTDDEGHLVSTYEPLP
jgi:L-aspartate oxidase